MSYDQLVQDMLNYFDKYNDFSKKSDRTALMTAVYNTLNLIQEHKDTISTELLDKLRARLTMLKQKLSSQEINIYLDMNMIENILS